MITDAKEIIDKAARLLNDLDFVRWTLPELLGYLNDGQLEIATLVPNSHAVTVATPLAAGSKQAAPADGIRIIEFIRNQDGPAIRQVERSTMDAYVPNWYASPSSATVVHAMYDPEKSPKVFYVYPPQPAINPGTIELIYEQIPAAIPNINPGTKITIADYYKNALVDYVLYRAFGKDSEYGNQATRSQGHYQAFANAIGTKHGADNNAQ